MEPVTSAKTVRKTASRAAEKALRKLIPGEHSVARSKSPPALHQEDDPGTWEDPKAGWSDDVVVRKKHFCLLLKPQIALCSEIDAESNLIAVGPSPYFLHIGLLLKGSTCNSPHSIPAQYPDFRLKLFG